MNGRRYQRNTRGVMGVLTRCVGLFVVLFVAHYFMNVMHLMMVRTQLQDAVDAAALAGASSLYKSSEDVKKAALNVAAGNIADGLRVSSKSPGTRVKVTSYPGDGIFPGCVKVEATRQVRFFGGKFCGLPDSTMVATSAMSGTAGSVVSVNQDQLFPLALSIDAIPMDRTMAENPLTRRHLGDNVVLFTNAQRTRNVAFTTFSHRSNDLVYLQAAIDQALKPQAEAAGTIPKVSVGDSININNSAFGTHVMAVGEHAFALSKQPLLTVPVVLGNPQRDTKATVVGFATFKVVGYMLSPGGQELDTLNVTMIKGMVHGISKPLPSTNKPEVDDALFEFSTGIPKLLPHDYLIKKSWQQRPQRQANGAPLNHEERLLPASAQRALRLATPSGETSSVPASQAGSLRSSVAAGGSPLAPEVMPARSRRSSTSSPLWWLYLLLTIPLAIAGIRYLTRERQKTNAAVPMPTGVRRSGRRARRLPKSPYAQTMMMNGSRDR